MSHVVVEALIEVRLGSFVQGWTASLTRPFGLVVLWQTVNRHATASELLESTLVARPPIQHFVEKIQLAALQLRTPLFRVYRGRIDLSILCTRHP